MKYYFAYGSNMHSVDLFLWCKEFSQKYPLGMFVSEAYLPDHDLVFNYDSRRRCGGVLSIVERTGQVVQGLVFEVEDENIPVLDLKEGAHNDGTGVYARIPVTVLLPDGRYLDAFTYQVTPAFDQGFVPPNEEYVDTISDVYDECGFDKRPLLYAAEGKKGPLLVYRLFVYGTLMKGECRSLDPRMASYERVGRAGGELLDLGGYPGMILTGRDDAFVLGEVHQLVCVGHALSMLDAVEGFAGFRGEGSLFRRSVVNVSMAGGRESPAWVYLYDGPEDAPRIPGGNWKTRNGAGHWRDVDTSLEPDTPAWCAQASRVDLERLRAAVISGEHVTAARRAQRWGGADVIIAPAPVPGTAKTVVVTRHYRELGWLFGALRVSFDWHLDYLNKYGFFGSLAEAACGYLEGGGGSDGGDATGLLLCVLDAAGAYLDSLPESQ